MGDMYTIRISESNSDDALATATVEIVDGKARIVEVHTSVEAGTVVPHQLGTIDFSLFVRTALVLSGTKTEPDAIDVEAPKKPESIEESEDAVTASAAPESAAPAMAAQHTTVPAARAEKMGMPADFAVNYWRLGSTAKVAKHYDVPHRIARDWIKALQQQGKAASSWQMKRARSSR
ncbi:hypothetical protein [Nocardia sp. CNY236]|uniref:hypothetical protein n=1 Tax=Nocardia sp. CNY236 TaxID=1169152 RepID=UPI00049091AB|nr:hypothetical protein [Nocardia sp. CNY236]